MWSTSPEIDIPEDVKQVLQSAGLAWGDIKQQISQIVLFGSRAVKVNTPTSDWDILLVGSGRSIHSRRVDIISISPKLINSRKWLGSELATHVATYGVWLFGSDDWRQLAFVSPEAVKRKNESVRNLVNSLHEAWPHLLPAARLRHVQRLCREYQRAYLLAMGRAVPPTALLDEICDKRWIKQAYLMERLTRALEKSDLPSISPGWNGSADVLMDLGR